MNNTFKIYNLISISNRNVVALFAYEAQFSFCFTCVYLQCKYANAYIKLVHVNKNVSGCVHTRIKCLGSVGTR